MLLDISKLPREAEFRGANGAVLDLQELVIGLRPTIDAWMDDSIVASKDSFGFALAGPGDLQMLRSEWNDPYSFVQLVVGWGPEGDRYIANAVRKLRALLRTGRDTLALRTQRSDLFSDPVDSSAADGTFQWGDFPWGGASIVRCGYIELAGAVSALKEVEDDFVVKTICGRLGIEMLRCAHPSEEMFG